MRLTAEQERLWLLQRLRPESSAYQLTHALWMQGPLDLDAWRTALQDVSRRHPLLRTSFPASDGRPRPATLERFELALPVVDLCHLPARQRGRAAHKILVAESRRPFDLESRPPIRAGAIRLDERHVLWFCAHRILLDEGSLEPLYRELQVLYNAARTGQAPDLPAPNHHQDFTDRQRSSLRDRAEDHLAYWRSHLASLEDLDLPTDRPRPAVLRHRGGQIQRAWPEFRAEALEEIARQHDTSLVAVFLAAFHAVLRCASGQRDLAIGCLEPNRGEAETRSILGPLEQYFVVRAETPARCRLGDLIHRIGQALKETQEHRALPLATLLQHLAPARDLSRHPLFQTTLTLRQGPPAIPRLNRLEIRSAELPTPPSVDLSLTVSIEGGTPVATMAYDTDLFDATTVARLLDHLREVLATLVSDPNRPLASLNLASRTQRAQVLREWNDTGAGQDRSATLHELFFQQAKRTPTQTAVIQGEEELTYEELSRRIRRLAAALRARGVGPEVPIGVCLDRTPSLIVALLAVLEAGGVYIPLDPAYPRDRLELILNDSAAPWVVTESRHTESLPTSGSRHLLLDREEALDPADDRGSTIASGAGNLAYVIYTSGSTGRPKGVAIEHRSAVTLLEWAHEHFRGPDLEGVLASTSVCFDLSVFEIFLPLTRGGTVILADHALHLPRLPAASRVTLLNTVPSAADGLLRLGELPANLRTVNLAGEPLTTALADRLYREPAVERVFDLYGPSEDTTYSTFTRRQPGGIATIGRPIGGTESYLLDLELNPVPRGSLGEVCLTGRGLARGYLRRPARTAAAFVPHPLAETPGERLYRTGDLARHLADGQLALAGRRDHQVKVRGFRVELGEIEAALTGHPGVQEAVVVKSAEDLGSRLVAYAVHSGAAAPGESELRAALHRQLPDFMVPSAIVLLEDLPRTPNGKIDRGALPDPEPASSQRQNEPSDLELDLQWIWEEILDATVELGDDFFKLGGDSFQAVHLLALIREELDVDLPLVAVFQAPTIEHLAARIEAIRDAMASAATG